MTNERSASYTSIENFDITTGIGDYNDTVTTATGNDRVFTDDGDDLVNVGAGKDTADGGAGNDRLSADFTADTKKVVIDLNDAVNSGSFGSFTDFEYFGTVTGSDFDDVLVSAAGRGAQTFTMRAGNDSVTVVNGSSTVNGGTGTDTLVVDFSEADATIFDSGAPSVNGTEGGFNGRYFSSNELSASYTSIERFDITGGVYTDTITTATGDDRFVMSAGADIYFSGGGADTIVLTDNFTASDALRVRDFSATDLFEVGAADFGGGLTAGNLPNSAFVANGSGTAQDANDRFIYNTSNGSLFYDADGNGAGAALLIATLDGAPTVTASDFLVV